MLSLAGADHYRPTNVVVRQAMLQQITLSSVTSRRYRYQHEAVDSDLELSITFARQNQDSPVLVALWMGTLLPC